MRASIYRKEEGKIVAMVPVFYAVSNIVKVEVDSLDELNKLINDREFVSQLPLGDTPDYLEDSYQIDKDFLQEIIFEFEDSEK